jgi:hypothetical protein
MPALLAVRRSQFFHTGLRGGQNGRNQESGSAFEKDVCNGAGSILLFRKGADCFWPVFHRRRDHNKKRSLRRFISGSPAMGDGGREIVAIDQESRLLNLQFARYT